MTVQELINLLSKIENKNKPVIVENDYGYKDAIVTKDIVDDAVLIYCPH